MPWKTLDTTTLHATQQTRLMSNRHMLSHELQRGLAEIGGSRLPRIEAPVQPESVLQCCEGGRDVLDLLVRHTGSHDIR